MAAVLAAAPVLAGCAGDDGAAGGGVAAQPFYVASFRPGEGGPAEQKYVLTSESGPRIRIVVATPGPPPAPPATGAPAPAIAWVNDGQYLAVTTYGSSSCPAGPQRIDVVADQEIEVRLGGVFPDRNVCTADLGPYVTVVKLPQGVTPAEPLTARFGKRTATLPAATG